MTNIVTNLVPRAERNGAAWLMRGEGAHGYLKSIGTRSYHTEADDGNAIAPGTTVSQLMRERGMDYSIGKHPTVVVYTDAEGKRIPLTDGNVRLVREPAPGSGATPILIGNAVKPSFEIVQNMEIAAMLDPLVREWPVRTAGEFDNGTKVFVALEAGDTAIGGDTMHDFFIVSDIRDGGHAVTIAYTTVRQVCSNGLMVVTKATRIKLPHSSSVKRETEFFIRFMAQVKGIQEAGREALNTLANKTVTREQAHTIIDAAHRLPEPPAKVSAFQFLKETHEARPANELTKDEVMRRMQQLQTLEQHAHEHGGKSVDEIMAAWESLKTRVQGHRERVYALYENEVSDHAGTGTAFLAVQAVAEYADWRLSDGDDAEDLAEAGLFGKRQDEKMRALVAAQNVTRAHARA